MDDLITKQTQDLIRNTKRSRNTSELIKWLWAGKEVQPVLADFIGDILSGAVKASPKKLKKSDAVMHVTSKIINSIFQTNRQRLEEINNQIKAGQKIENWQAIEDELKAAGYIGLLETKGEITKAAKCITAKQLDCTLSQLDEIRRNRER